MDVLSHKDSDVRNKHNQRVLFKYWLKPEADRWPENERKIIAFLQSHIMRAEWLNFKVKLSLNPKSRICTVSINKWMSYFENKGTGQSAEPRGDNISEFVLHSECLSFAWLLQGSGWSQRAVAWWQQRQYHHFHPNPRQAAGWIRQQATSWAGR